MSAVALTHETFQTEADRLFLLQKENRWKVANSTAKERRAKLKALKAALLKHEDDLIEAMFQDFRKPAAEVQLTEIMPVVHEINDAIKNVAAWMESRHASTPLTMFGARSRLVYEPRGVCLVIGPWNYPVNLALSPVVAAIAAGNCVILKPASNTAHTSRVLKTIINACFPEEEIAVILGNRHISNALLEMPFDHIFFTGSPAVGAQIMSAAAKHMASVTLELGGKSPAIVDESAHMPSAVERVAWGKFLNGGQTCVGVDYALVHESRLAEFIAAFKAQVKKFYGDNPEAWRATPDFCRVINDTNFTRIQHSVERSLDAGAKLEIGGVFEAAERFIAPTLLSEVPPDSPIMQEEIFGPVLPVLAYRDLDEALRFIQARPKPLALYIFSTKDANIRRVMKNTSSGATVVNCAVVHPGNPYLPFGGVNHSGIGSYHGYFGFKAFSHERAVIFFPRFSLLAKLFPPYSGFTRKLITFMTKYL